MESFTIFSDVRQDRLVKKSTGVNQETIIIVKHNKRNVERRSRADVSFVKNLVIMRMRRHVTVSKRSLKFLMSVEHCVPALTLHPPSCVIMITYLLQQFFSNFGMAY